MQPFLLIVQVNLFEPGNKLLTIEVLVVELTIVALLPITFVHLPDHVPNPVGNPPCKLNELLHTVLSTPAVTLKALLFIKI